MDADGPAPPCVCVLCGLPAAGKSTLARSVCGVSAERGWRCAVLPYDELIPEGAFHAKAARDGCRDQQDAQTEWKSHRQALLQCLDQALTGAKPGVVGEPPTPAMVDHEAWRRCTDSLSLGGDTSPLLIVLDDNFYYPSMRHEVYQLARKHSLGFCQVYLKCPVESCVSRNQRRSRPLPTSVILEMSKRLEPPNPQRNSWEKNSITLNSDCLSEMDIESLLEFISSALSNPLIQVEDNTEQKEADRLKCAVSVVHQADQVCRRLVSEAMKTARENQVPPEQMRFLASEMNESKTKFLHHLRTQYLQELPVIRGEDIDVHHVVKTATDAFDTDIKEILFETLRNGHSR